MAALVGRERYEIKIKNFINSSQSWDSSYTLNFYQAYSGQGFDFPEDQTWINKPTGTSTTGMIMGFPRSSESLPPTPPVGGTGWQVKEC